MKLQICALLLAMLMVAGCKHKAEEHGHDHEEDHEAHHEEESVQITAWSQRFEVFVDHEAAVAGEAIPLAIHLTEIRTGIPPESPIEIKGTGNNGGEIHVKPEASSPGLYVPKITFPKTGEWKLNVMVGGNEVIELPAIRVFKDHEEAHHAEKAATPEGITVFKEQQWRLRLQTGLVSNQVVTQSVRLLGKVTPKPGSMAVVSAPTAGRVLTAGGGKIALPGQRVKAGEPLLMLEPVFSESTARLLEAEAEAIRAKAAFEMAERNLQRTRQLAASEAKSPRELQEAEFAFAQAKGAFDAATALQSTYKKIVPGDGPSTNLKQIELRAPIDGIITDASPNLGKVVSAQQPLFTIANSEEVWIEAQVPERVLAHLGNSPEGTLNDGTGLKFVFRGMQIDEASRSAPVAFSLSNSNKGLLTGQMVEVQARTLTSTNTIGIPESAIVEEDGKPIAFVQLGGETFEKRHLEIGIRGGGVAQIISGLKEGERVVVEGAYAVRLASVSTTIPAHDHPH